MYVIVIKTRVACDYDGNRKLATPDIPSKLCAYNSVAHPWCELYPASLFIMLYKLHIMQNT